MNCWQLMRQMKKLLSDATWGDGSDERVFRSVYITERLEPDALASMSVPFALLRILSATPDPNAPGLLTQQVAVDLGTVVRGGTTGERPLIGANRTGQGSSQGRGVLEVQEQVERTFEQAQWSEGVRLVLRNESSAETAQIDGIGGAGSRRLIFRARIGTKRSYPDALYLRGTDQGGGNVLLEWTRAPDRYDRNEQVLRRASGSTAPSGPTDGTDVPIGPTDESVTDSPGAGTFSYALFTGYDETSKTPTTTDRFSDGVVAEGVTVT